MNTPNFEHIFVLNTGRCGSKTFSKACKHIKNYTSAHESRINIVRNKFHYSKYHIEIDNRLSWFLYFLDQYNSKKTFFVHLFRNEQDVINSFVQRKGGHKSLLNNFIKGICYQKDTNQNRQIFAKRMIKTIKYNINNFLVDKNYMNIQIEKGVEQFPKFCKIINASVDIEKATNEFKKFYNQGNSQ